MQDIQFIGYTSFLFFQVVVRERLSFWARHPHVRIRRVIRFLFIDSFFLYYHFVDRTAGRHLGVCVCSTISRIQLTVSIRKYPPAVVPNAEKQGGATHWRIQARRATLRT
jgi:hypothetical protein